MSRAGLCSRVQFVSSVAAAATAATTAAAAATAATAVVCSRALQASRLLQLLRAAVRVAQSQPLQEGQGAAGRCRGASRITTWRRRPRAGSGGGQEDDGYVQQVTAVGRAVHQPRGEIAGDESVAGVPGKHARVDLRAARSTGM